MEELTEQRSSYLNRYREKKHRFARMICEPRIDAGLVHTPAEIAQQPLLWNITASQMSQMTGTLKTFLKESGLFDTSHRPHVIFTGAGTSDFVGMSLTDLFRNSLQVQASNWSTPRITANPDSFFSNDQRYLLIHFARSGNSPESKAVLNLALKKYPDNIRNIVITCNADGQLSEIAGNHPDQVLLITLHKDCNDKGLAMTSSFSSMVVAALSLIHTNDPERYLEIIENMASSAEFFIDRYADDIYELADPSYTRAFFLGNKDLLGAATESALKVQELTAGELIAKGDDTLTFRHGPVSAVDNGSVVCFFLSEDSVTRQYELDVIRQYEDAFLKMGASSIVIGSNPGQFFQNSSVTCLEYDPAGKWNIPVCYQVNLAVLFGQLYALFQAYRRNINVDDPSTEKSTYNRVVQGVKLYEE